MAISTSNRYWSWWTRRLLKWNFVLSSKYTTIKPGPGNKITARYTCRDNPAAISFYSINITGVGTTTTTPLVGAAPPPHTIGPSLTAANKNTTNANANLTTIPSTNASTNNQPAERTTHVSKSVKITSPSRSQEVPIVVQCLKCLVITSTNSSTDSKMVTTDNVNSHGKVSVIVNGINQHHNVADIIHLGHHGFSGDISRHHKPMVTAGSGSGSSDNKGQEPGGKGPNGNNLHNKGSLIENHPLNNGINVLQNTIMENANKQLKIRGVQLPLPIP